MKQRLAIWSIGVIVVLGVTPLAAPTPLEAQLTTAQGDDPLLRRWVGHYARRPIFLDFYGDSLLVFNDSLALNFRFTWDSIIAWGDTSFALRYEIRYDPRFNYHRLLITTERGTQFTMAPQGIEARPLYDREYSGVMGRWMASDSQGQLVLYLAPRGSARWRRVPGGSWVYGEWDRQARDITFVWNRDSPDSTRWTGHYDAPRSLLFDEIEPGGGSVIFRPLIR